MKPVESASFMILSIIALGLLIDEANADLSPNNVFVLEGSGFASTTSSLEPSQIDLLLSTGNQATGSSNVIVQDGFVTLGNQDFIVSDLGGTVLRDGRFLRLVGTAENLDSVGAGTTLSIFGRLVQSTDAGSVYTFTGKITHEGQSHKIVYVTKIHELALAVPQIDSSDTTTSPKTPSTVSTTPTKETQQTSSPTTSRPVANSANTILNRSEEGNIKITIFPGSSTRGLATDWIEANKQATDLIKQQENQRAGNRYFSFDRIRVEPGDTVSFINNDSTSHSLESGNQNYKSRNNIIYSPDGRITSDVIPPGGTTNITFDLGFYRIYDPDYPWMNLIVYSFPSETDSIVIRQANDNVRN